MVDSTFVQIAPVALPIAQGTVKGDGDHGCVRARQSRERMEAHGSQRSEVDACNR
jgi:hypothetical protein